jgi:tetratricopeptide (TPR) repeat protein
MLRELCARMIRSLPRRVGVMSLGVGAVAASGLILYGPARSEMGGGAVALMLLHLGLGLPLGVWALTACLVCLRPARWPLTAAVALCLGTGVLIVARAAGGAALRGGDLLLAIHIPSGLAALALGWSFLTGKRGPAVASLRRPIPTPRLALLIGLVPAAGSALAAYRYEPEAYYRSLTATNAAQARNPRFPGGVLLEGEHPWRAERPAAYCGAAGCHEPAYREWLASAHANAGSDPFYQASRHSFAARSGAAATRWCAGCHEPTSLLGEEEGSHQPGTKHLETGRKRPACSFQRPVNGPAPTETPRRRSRLQAAFQANRPTVYGGSPTAASPGHLTQPAAHPRGITCLGCHAATRVQDLMGNGRMVLAAPPEYPFAERREPALRWLHGFLLRLRPAPHRAAFLKPELQPAPEFCSACHRMSFNVPQNHYKFLPGMDEYGAWQESPVSGRSIHGFQLAARTQTCVGCHMPPVRDRAGGRSHAFLGGNTALPALRGDRTQLAATERFLRSGALSVDLFALRRNLPGRPHQEELRAPLEDASLPLRPGESVVVDVVVRNRGVGHDFPAGSGDLRDVWLAVALAEVTGRPLAASGLIDGDGAVDPEAHAYRLIALDRTGRRIDRNNLDEMVTVVAPSSPRTIPSGEVDLRTIPAGESDLARYRFTVPRMAGRLQLTARLLHRAVNPGFARWALRHGPDRPPLPVTPLAEDSLTFVVAPAPVALTRVPAPAPGREAQAMRFYDYGVALLRQSDLARAAGAMRRAAELLPRRPEGPLGLGRVYLEEGDLIAARDQFLAGLRLAPRDARARLFLGRTYRKMGQYEGALAILQPLAAQFPRDRALQFEIGQCQFQRGRYEEASEAFTRMLDVDPNELAAHYNLMSCNRQLRRFPEARREEAIYRYLKEDESVRRLTADYLEAHPAVAREAQSIHEHLLRPVRRSIGLNHPDTKDTK